MVLGNDRELAASVAELRAATCRDFIVTIVVVCAFWQAVTLVAAEDATTIRVFVVVVSVVSSGVLALWLLKSSLLLAQSAWQAGLAFTLVLAAWLLDQPAILLLFSLLPLMATLCVGVRFGLMIDGAMILLIGWLSTVQVVPQLPPVHQELVMACGTISVLIGWVATRPLLTVTQWSLKSYEQAVRNMEEARDRQVELLQTREDLLQVNRHLASLTDSLKASQHTAEEARRVKAQFVANVSHELRTPLNLMIGFSETIPHSARASGVVLPPTVMADLSAIRRNGQHLARLVDDVLDLSQVEAGRMALSKEWVSVADIVDAAVLAVGTLYHSRGLFLKAEVPPDLPCVYCDSTRIRQVLLNLLSNAGRFTQEGGVRVSTRQSGNRIVVSVTDTGPGIRVEDRDRIFEPFQQVDATLRRRQGGNGLGLSISKQLVEMHNGSLWFEEHEGAGSTFSFSLPLDGGDARAFAARGGVSSAEFGTELLVRGRSSLVPSLEVVRRLVVFEKGVAIVRLLRRYLHNTEILHARTESEARSLLSHAPAQALIINSSEDAGVSAENSWTRSLPSEIPVVVCYVPEDNVSGEIGVAHYLVKPVSPDDLLSTLGKLDGNIRRVLLVDDDPDTVQLLSRVLGSADAPFLVIRAMNGHRALDLLRTRQPDVMILDLVMPDLDGFQVLQEKQKDPSIRDIPVIAVSSRDPRGEPIVCSAVTVTRAGGIPASELLSTIDAIVGTLNPTPESVHQGSPGMLHG